jgi:predicted unusual protein kinase regulating ubiquinone biosynthesis (AarF/ABC1/UbiB family)
LDARNLFDELRARVMAEVDYRQEAAAQTAFAQAFRDDDDFFVPPVVASTDRVLVSEWIDGTPVAQIARRGHAAQREQVALLLTRFLLSSPPRVGRLHGDPHPGNFRLLDDGRLAVVDFGSSLSMPHRWSPRLAALLRAGRDRDESALFDIAVATGLVQGTTVTPEALLDLVDPLLEPLRHDSFAFTRRWLRAQTTRISDPRSSTSRTQRKLRMPVRHLLVQRVVAGTTGVLCQLEAPVPLAGEAARWLPELERFD